jgi:sporulation protein YlmC with PRC-barrel domain
LSYQPPRKIPYLNKTKIARILIFGLGLSLGAIGQAVAKNQTASPVKSEPTLQITPTRHTTLTPPETSLTTTRSTTEIAGTTAQPTEEAALRATELLGYPAENPQGETLGEIEDVMLGLESEQVSYVVLSFGGFLDLGDKLVVVPIDLVTLDTDQDRLIADVSEEQLTNAPTFDSDAWPNASYSDWDLTEHEYWSDQTEMKPDEPAIRATEFLDFQVVNARLETLGEIEDLMIGLIQERVNYAILSLSGDDQLTPVPHTLISLDTSAGELVVNTGQGLLENAPGFNAETWPDSSTPQWDTIFRNYWSGIAIPPPPP